MVSTRERVDCVLWLAELKSVSSVRQRYWEKYARKSPSENSIREWMKKFKETGSICDKPRPGRPTVSDEVVRIVRDAFRQCPKKSIRKVSMELNIPKSTVLKILKAHGDMTDHIPETFCLARTSFPSIERPIYRQPDSIDLTFPCKIEPTPPDPMKTEEISQQPSENA